MLLLAHFTPTEIPGTLAVLALGICIGAALVQHRWRSLFTPLGVLAAFVFASALADQLRWPTATKLGIDSAGLLIAVAIAATILIGHRHRRLADRIR